jgi:hypothetical protein
MDVLKNSARRGFLALGSNGRTIFGPREEKVRPLYFRTIHVAFSERSFKFYMKKVKKMHILLQ